MFMKDYAKFTAKIAKGMKVGEKDVELKLLIPLKVMQENFLFLSSKQEQDVNIFLGDPQAAFDFDDEDGEVYRAVTGRRFMTDASGVVTNLERPEDPDQAKLFDPEDGDSDEGEEQDDKQDGEGGQEGAEVPDAGEDPDNEPGTGDPEENSEEPPANPQQSISEEDDAALLEEMEGGSGGRRLIDQDTPDWMQETGEGGSREQEVQFEGDGAEESESSAEQPQGGSASADGQDKSEPADVDKDALDTYILTERPVFPEVEFNGMPVPFADLWEQRLQGSKTWIEIAKETGMTSGQLSARRAEYKKLATKKMQGGGGAA